MIPTNRLRAAVILVLTGILCEFIALIKLTPATFLLFAAIGIPCLVVGVMLYALDVLRRLREKAAL